MAIFNSYVSLPEGNLVWSKKKEEAVEPTLVLECTTTGWLIAAHCAIRQSNCGHWQVATDVVEAILYE